MTGKNDMGCEDFRGPRSISAIARDIRRDWSKHGKGVNYAAKPYLEAMASLDKITDNCGSDSAEYVILYFLGNAKTYRSPKAKELKAELKALLKSKR